MVGVVILILLFSFWLGYTFSRKLIWPLIFFVPIIYPTFLIVINISMMPLTFERLIFVLVFGMFIKEFKIINKFFSSSNTSKLFFIFVSILAINSLRDDGYKSIVFTYIPDLFVGFVLPILAIKCFDDFTRLIKYLIVQLSLFCVLILLEYFTRIQINGFLVNASSLTSITGEGIAFEIRAGFYRVNGIDSNAVQTAYRIVMLLPLTILYLIKRNIFYMFPFILAIISIILLQSRASMFVAIFSFFILSFILIFSKQIDFLEKKTILRKYIYLFILFSVLIIFFFPFIFDIFIASYINIFKTQQYVDYELVRDRDLWIQNAYKVFMKKPYFGYGSPINAYKNVDWNDLPSYGIYFLSGGIFLGFFYFLFWGSLFLDLHRFLKIINKKIHFALLVSAISVFAGFAVTLFNWQERHYLVLFLIFFAMAKLIYIQHANFYIFPKHLSN